MKRSGPDLHHLQHVEEGGRIMTQVYMEEFNSAFFDEGTPAKEYNVKDEYRPRQVSRYYSPGGQGVYGSPKNRPTMLGQSRIVL